MCAEAFVIENPCSVWLFYPYLDTIKLVFGMYFVGLTHLWQSYEENFVWFDWFELIFTGLSAWTVDLRKTFCHNIFVPGSLGRPTFHDRKGCIHLCRRSKFYRKRHFRRREDTQQRASWVDKIKGFFHPGDKIC